MEPETTSQPSQSLSLVQEEQFQLQSIIEELENVYSDYVSDMELLWAQFKAATEEACQSKVSELHRDLATLQDCQAQMHTLDEQMGHVNQYVASMSQHFQRK